MLYKISSEVFLFETRITANGATHFSALWLIMTVERAVKYTQHTTQIRTQL